MSDLDLEPAGCDGGVEGRNGHLVERLFACIAKVVRQACGMRDAARCKLRGLWGAGSAEIRDGQSSKGNGKKPWRWKIV